MAVARADEPIEINGYFRDAGSNTYADPEHVTLELKDEGDRVTRYVYPAQVQQVSAGIYRYITRLPAGNYRGKWTIWGPSEPEYLPFAFVIAPSGF